MGYKKKKRPNSVLPTRYSFQLKGLQRLKVQGCKKIFHTNENQKRAGVAILRSDKIDFKSKTIARDKEGHYIMIKGLIHSDNITI